MVGPIGQCEGGVYNTGEASPSSACRSPFKLALSVFTLGSLGSSSKGLAEEVLELAQRDVALTVVVDGHLIAFVEIMLLFAGAGQFLMTSSRSFPSFSQESLLNSLRIMAPAGVLALQAVAQGGLVLRLGGLLIHFHRRRLALFASEDSSSTLLYTFNEPLLLSEERARGIPLR